MMVAEKLARFVRKSLSEQRVAIDAAFRDSIDVLSRRTHTQTIVGQLREIRNAMCTSAATEGL